MLKLTADSTFNAKVAIPVPGKDAVDVGFDFKHRTKDELKAFLADKKVAKSSDAEYVMELATGWELTDEFNVKNVAVFLQHYHRAASAIRDKYFAELADIRLKN